MHQETLDLALRVSDWHADRYNYLAGLHESLQEGFELSIDNDAPIKLTADQAKFLKLGITSALQAFYELPYSLHGPAEGETETDAK